jgi:hypothetical protein
MWFTDAVDVPDEIVDALSDGNLVIFVGAGASLAHPSNLPLFTELTRLVAQDAHRPYDPNTGETEDAFLDRLERTGVSVHELVRARVGRTDSQPNALHSAIVELFTRVEDVRVVTTNYDKHLSTAAEQKFGVAPPSYCGPALPLGRDFSGIVNIHGCEDGRASDLVVTSTDFGRAYLTDAWAARFLSELFARYTTLFVGYSHKDVVMKYLAQGLRPGSRRFGFLSDDQDAGEWGPLELQPIPYPHSADHGALNEVITAWSEWVRMGLLDHESRMKLLVAKDPPVTPADVSYVERTIRDDVNCRFFAQHAPKTAAWLDWIVHRPPFRTLFAPGRRLSPAASMLAAWFTDCVLEVPDEALSSAQTHGGMLSEDLAARIAYAFSRSSPDPKALGRWAALLVGTTAAEPCSKMSALLASRRWPDDRDVALFLLEHLMQPRVTLRPTFRLSGGGAAEDSTEFQIDSLFGDDYWLREAWSDFFRPHLEELAERVSAIIEHRLTSIHRTLQTVSQANDRWDTHSFLRSGIEPNGQDNLLSPVGFLVDCGRDCLVHLLAHHVEVGAALVARWERSEAPLLRRLAMHGWIERSDKSSAEKLQHVLDGQHLFHYATKHEVFRLIQTCLPSAHDFEDDFLAAILAGPPARDSLDGAGLNQRLFLDLLTWAAQTVPDSSAISEALALFRADHPDLQPSSHLGQDLWIEPGFHAPDPVPVEDLLACHTIAALEELLAAAAVTDLPAAFMSALQVPQLLASTAAETPSWAITLIEDLCENKLFGSEYWEPLMSGLSRALPAVDAATTLRLMELVDMTLREAAAAEEAGALLPVISDLILSVVRLPSVERTLLDKLEGVALLVAQHVGSGPEPPAVERLERALDHAYNTWTGWAARFWVGAISQRWRLDEDSWSGMSSTEKDAAQLLLRSGGERLPSVQIIFGANYAFLLSADQQWCDSQLLPLFDWTQLSAERVWAGFVQERRWDERALRDLKPSMREAFAHLRNEVGKQLAEAFGEVVVRSSADNTGDGTIGDFIARADIPMRKAFAESVGWWLHQMTPASAEQAWGGWILGYLADRVADRPLALDPEESGAMLRWVTAASDHFPQAVGLYLQAPIALDHVTLVFKDIEDRAIADHHPRPLARLLNSVLAGTTSSWISCGDLNRLVHEFLERLEAGDRGTILGICTQAIRLGCDAAVGWRDAVNAKWPLAPAEDGHTPSAPGAES